MVSVNPQKIAKNTTFYTSSLVIQKMLAFIYFWFISNNLFPDSLGKYVFALSFTTLFSILIDLGLSPILTREAAKSDEKSNKYLKNVLGLKIPLAIITLVLVVLFINITGKPELVKLLVYLASAVMLLDSFTLSFYAIFRAKQNMFYESIGTVIFQIINFTFGIIALKITGDIRYLMFALISASGFNFLFSLILLKWKLNFSLKPTWDKDILKHFLKIAPAFALAGIFVKIYNTSDSVLLGYLADDASVGFFAVPAKVMYALQGIIPGAFAAVIYPAFSNYYVTSKELLRKTFERASAYLIIISIPMAIGLVALSEKVLRVVWPEYIKVDLTFQIMALALPFIFVAFATGSLLNACDRQRNNTINRGIITAASIIINIILIPYLKYLGAGIAFLAVNILLIILDLIWIEKVLKYDKVFLLKLICKSLFAALVMWLILWLVAEWFNLIILIILGTIVYFALMFMLKGLSIKDVRSVRESFR